MLPPEFKPPADRLNPDTICACLPNTLEVSVDSSKMISLAGIAQLVERQLPKFSDDRKNPSPTPNLQKVQHQNLTLTPTIDPHQLP